MLYSMAAWPAKRTHHPRRSADRLCAPQWGEGVFGAAQVFTATSLSTRAQLGMAAVSGSLLATDYEATRNHAWSDVKGKARPAACPLSFGTSHRYVRCRAYCQCC
jgi:hypothetical protein